MSEYLKTLSRYFQFVGMRNDANSPNGVIEEDVTCWVRPVLNEHASLTEKVERLEEYIETYHDEDYVLWCRESDALLESE